MDWMESRILLGYVLLVVPALVFGFRAGCWFPSSFTRSPRMDAPLAVDVEAVDRTQAGRGAVGPSGKIRNEPNEADRSMEGLQGRWLRRQSDARTWRRRPDSGGRAADGGGRCGPDVGVPAVRASDPGSRARGVSGPATLQRWMPGPATESPVGGWPVIVRFSPSRGRCICRRSREAARPGWSAAPGTRTDPAGRGREPCRSGSVPSSDVPMAPRGAWRLRVVRRKIRSVPTAVGRASGSEARRRLPRTGRQAPRAPKTRRGTP